MDINNTLFQALLRQQNISEFRPFKIDIYYLSNSKLGNQIKIDYRYVNLDDIFAYVKDGVFHICNQNFEVIDISKFLFECKGIVHIDINNDNYVYPSVGSEKSIVIDSKGNIISTNPTNFFYVGTKEFLEDSPLFITDYCEGLVYSILDNKFIVPRKFDFWNGYKEDYDINLPIIKDKIFIQEGKENPNLQYLFSIKKSNCSPVPTLSYFLDKKSKDIFLFESSEYGSEMRELSPVCLWHTNGNVFAISIKMLNDIDNKGDVIKSTDTYDFSFKFEISVSSGNTFGIYSKRTLGLNFDSLNKNKLKSFLSSFIFTPTKNALLISREKYNHGFDVILISDNGQITFCGELEGSSIAFTESNILRLGCYESNDVEYYDIFGNLICRADIYAPEFQFFSRALKEPSRFNSNEIACQRNHFHFRRYDNDVLDAFWGVIDLKTGNVIIPPCYSKIQLHKLHHIFDESVGDDTYTAIVQIDNFPNGNISTLFGIYLNDRLILPIFYLNIEFLTYKMPKGDDELIPFQISDESRYFDSKNSDYLLLQKDNLFGLAVINGHEIVSPCAESVSLLEKTHQRQVESDGEKRIWLQHIPRYSDPNYVKMLKDGRYNLVYKDRVISDFQYSEVKIFSVSNFDTEYIFIKAFKDGQVTLYFEGSQIIDFYENIKVYFSTVGNQFDDDFEVVFLVMNDLGQKSLLNNKGDIIIPFSSSSIFPYRNYVVHGDTIINSECDILFNSEGYTLIAEKSSYPNERLICFYNDESKYAIIDGNGTLYEFEDIEELDAATFSCGYNEYKFDIDANEFIKIEDEEDGYHDYNEPDDYDYDRDTYYALGGDDYDRFKENGGSIDDMMDYLGY